MFHRCFPSMPSQTERPKKKSVCLGRLKEQSHQNPRRPPWRRPARWRRNWQSWWKSWGNSRKEAAGHMEHHHFLWVNQPFLRLFSIAIFVYQRVMIDTGWWWLEPWNFMTFPSYWEFHHPNWPSFFRGLENTNQEDTAPSKGGCWLFNKVRDSGRLRMLDGG